MIKAIIIIFIFILTFVVALDVPKSATSETFTSTADTTLQLDDKIEDEFEEYRVEDYIDEMYTETECQDCLLSAEADGCLEVHSDCIDLPDCSDWSSCVGWCDAYEGDDDCYLQCDESFIDNDSVEVDFRICVCEKCGMYCRALCDVEGF